MRRVAEGLIWAVQDSASEPKLQSRVHQSISGAGTRLSSLPVTLMGKELGRGNMTGVTEREMWA